MNKSKLSPRSKRVATIVAVGAAIPGMAFFAGVQSGGGAKSIAQAAAKATQQQGRGGPPQGGPLGNPGFASTLAGKLGVSSSAVKQAIDAFCSTHKPPRPGDANGGKDDRLSALASALGVSQGDLKAALDKLRPSGAPPAGPRSDGPQRGGPRGGGPGGPQDPHGGPGFGPPHGAQFAKQLAAALGIDQSKVADAFKQFGSQHKAQMDKREQALAQYLAGKLNLSVDKVKSALDAMHPPRVDAQRPRN